MSEPEPLIRTIMSLALSEESQLEPGSSAGFWYIGFIIYPLLPLHS